MVDQVLLGLQAIFIVVLYLFIWRVVRSTYRGLRPAQESFVLAPSAREQPLPGGHSQQPAPGNGNGRPARLVVTESTAVQAGVTYNVGPVPITIGRSDENALVLEEDAYASGQHARIEAGRDGVWVSDLGSTNGTLVNGERVEGRRLLSNGDLLRVGQTELRFER